MACGKYMTQLTAAWRAGEDIYTDALRFVPERWYAKPEMIKERSAYAPFSLGTPPDPLTLRFRFLLPIACIIPN